MNKIILLLFLGSLLTSPLFGETMMFKEFNFSVEHPSSWQSANPPPANATGFIQSEDGTKGMVIIASKFAQNRLSTALEDMVDGAKKSAAAQGIDVQNEKEIKINGILFKSFTTKTPDGASIVSYMGLVDNIGYSLQGFNKASEAAIDAEIINIVNSFDLINKSALSASGRKSDNDAYQFGKNVGRIAFVILALGTIWILVAKKRNKMD